MTQVNTATERASLDDLWEDAISLVCVERYSYFRRNFDKFEKIT